MSSKRVLLILASVAALTVAPLPAAAFGPDGHRIAGLLAEPRLCKAARDEVRTLAGGESLAELGLWADTIRSRPEWRDSAPWHYMNVADPRRGGDSLQAARTSIARFRHPREGDVLVAIERFRAALADRSRPAADRLDALRFLVHFVVDVHQPLHVGRADDRGGNTIDVEYAGTVVNLHRFWDTDVIELRHLSPQRHARQLARSVRDAAAAGADLDPAEWAAESLALRDSVYAFGTPDARKPIALSADYIAAAQRITDERLTRAAERLAATLNAVLCR